MREQRKRKSRVDEKDYVWERKTGKICFGEMGLLIVETKNNK